MKPQAAKAKHRTTRPPLPAPRAYEPIKAPSPADIKAGFQRLRERPPVTQENADAVLAENGIPAATAASTPIKQPAPATESWSEAFWAVMKLPRRFLELVGHAVIAVVTPLLTAAVDGLGVLVVAVTVWEGWRPATALADAFVAWCGANL